MSRPLALVRFTVILAAIGAAACSSTDKRLQQHQKKLESLGSSAAAVSEAWIGGDVSSAYTQTSFGQILLLVEQERTAIVSKPDALADPRAADLSQRADQLSRLLALMTRDVQARDANALRAHLAQIPLRPSS